MSSCQHSSAYSCSPGWFMKHHTETMHQTDWFQWFWYKPSPRYPFKFQGRSKLTNRCVWSCWMMIRIKLMNIHVKRMFKYSIYIYAHLIHRISDMYICILILPSCILKWRPLEPKKKVNLLSPFCQPANVGSQCYGCLERSPTRITSSKQNFKQCQYSSLWI